ncbi:DUF6049 family protein [Flexivirga oryzae]|uniref:Uncharacterized protein n=1 Tax=Flexivirga oryzae TaxID=1794944 RepID=A0A839NGX1_9MICO|nr:DUF6049 family protein [Flexivirga oryzae]MBB2893672.1 hypothetical protein [Flexivirga oryzae]
MNDASSRQRGSTWPRRHEHLVALCAALLTAALCLLPFGASRAAAAAVSSTVRISLVGNEPAVSASGQAVIVSGTLTNTGSAAIDDPVVHLSINGERLLDTRSAANDWMSGKLDLPVQQVATGTTDPLAPGATTSFAVTIPGNKLKFSYGLASLPLAVTVTDGRTSSASGVRGTARSTLHQQNATVDSPLRLTVVIPLTLPADPDLFGPSGATRAAAWERAVGPDSRVQRLLDAFAGMPVAFAVDPELLDPPAAADDNVPSATPTPSGSSTSGTQQSDGSTSAQSTEGTEDATTAPNPTSTAAATSGDATTTGTASGTATGGSTGDESRTTTSESPSSSSSSSTAAPNSPAGRIATAVDGLAQRLAALDDPGSVWWLPADDPDLVALDAAGRDGQALLRRDLTRALPDTATDISTTRVVIPAGDTPRSIVTAATKRLAGDGREAIAVLPDRMLPAASAAATTATHRASGTSGVLTYDERLSRLFGASSTSPGTQTGRLLTQSLAIYQQSPGSSRSLAILAPRTGGANPTDLAARVGALETATWLQLRSGAQTVKSLRSAPRATLLTQPRKGTPYPTVPATAITVTELRDLDRSRRQLAALQSVLVGGDEVLPQRTQALDIIGSTRWRGSVARLASVADRDDAAVSAMLGKLSIRSSTINFFADSGDISVTIANDLNRPVHGVLLNLRPRKVFIQVTDAEKSVDVDAGAHAATRFHIKAVGAGTVPVDALLHAPDGAPLGPPGAPSQLKINVHPTSGWIMWVLGVLAALVLVIGLWRAVRRGPRAASEATPADEPTPEETIVDAGPGAPQPTDDEGTGDR